ncbi:hypothetical protein HPB51_027691 [Rhipicephalus microplus]|uniref:Ig-like domain-containing protein n=1 Tax=Rhipicephalus microplus TaxID=6941 RepID=A0A9J6CZC4_RHIMP|nr:hypothetical protein HPB51_027691 [Rhipicephalus microplus]
MLATLGLAPSSPQKGTLPASTAGGTSKCLIVREGHQTELPCDLRDALSHDSLAFVHWYHSPERDLHSGSSGVASPLGYGFRAAVASREPIYTVDFGPNPTLSAETTAGATGGNGATGGRGNNLLQVSRSAGHGWIGRAYFSIIGHPASLKVNSVRFEDAGLYTCTAVYRDDARRNSTVRLHVVGAYEGHKFYRSDLRNLQWCRSLKQHFADLHKAFMR